MSKKALLLLESDPDTVSRFERISGLGNFSFEHVETFRDAFSAIKVKAKDLAVVLMDFERSTDDVDLLMRLRKLDFDRPIPVVLLGQVPLTDAEIQQLAQDSGYTGYLFRGMTDEDILTRLQAFVSPAGDRRRAPRAYVQTRALLRFQDERLLVAETYTLSENGVFLKCREKLPEAGQSLELQMAVPDGERTIEVKTPVEVVYTREFNPEKVSIHPPGFAVRFLGLSPEVEAALREIVSRQPADESVETESMDQN